MLDANRCSVVDVKNILVSFAAIDQQAAGFRDDVRVLPPRLLFLNFFSDVFIANVAPVTHKLSPLGVFLVAKSGGIKLALREERYVLSLVAEGLVKIA